MVFDIILFGVRVEGAVAVETAERREGKWEFALLARVARGLNLMSVS
jgi:hypothetical protein